MIVTSILLFVHLLCSFQVCGGFVLLEGQRAARRRHHALRVPLLNSHPPSNSPKSGFSGSAAETNLLQLTTAHFTSQALHTFVKLGIADVFVVGDTTETLTVDDIATRVEDKSEDAANIPKEALFRILRLLTAADVVYQSLISDDNGDNEEITFGLTDTGMLLRQPPTSATASFTAQSLAPFVMHWLEEPIWNAFSELPHYMTSGNASNYPFDRAHDGMSAPEYYSSQTKLDPHRQHRSQVAQQVSGSEIPAVIDAINWAAFANQTIVDIGGGYGDLMAAVVEETAGIHDLNMTCLCLELPSVVNGVESPAGVTLVPGDMFEPTSIPPCDVIITKHVLCDWSDEDVIRMLKSCHSVLSDGGQVVVVDAVLLDGPEASSRWQIQAAIDVLLMLTGRHMDRSTSQWRSLASSSGFRMDQVISCPSSPSLNITMLSKI